MTSRLLLALLLSACSTKSSGDTPSTNTTTTDTTEIEVSDSCNLYLDCLVEVMPEGFGVSEEIYGPASSCWEDEDSARRCSDACDGELDTLRAAGNANDDACWSSDAVYGEGEWIAVFAGSGIVTEFALASTGGDTFEMIEGSSTLVCTLSDSDFTCEGNYWESGTFTSPWIGTVSANSIFGDDEATIQFCADPSDCL